LEKLDLIGNEIGGWEGMLRKVEADEVRRILTAAWRIVKKFRFFTKIQSGKRPVSGPVRPIVVCEITTCCIFVNKPLSMSEDVRVEDRYALHKDVTILNYTKLRLREM
jgi:hypothetical protein